MKKKKILFIIWSFTYGGGAEKILANLVNKLDSNKYDIDIIEYWHSNIHTEKVNSNIRILKPIVDSTKASKIRMLVTKIMLEKFPFILRKIYIKDKYDYEIAFNSMIPTFLLDKKAKTISWNHGDLYSLKEKKHDMKLQKKSFKYVNKIVAISKNTYESILDVFPEYKDKTLIINNSFDFDNVLKLSNEQIEIKKEKFTLLFVGRFDENKNPLFLIDVCKKLKLLNKDFQLWFIGKGKLESKMNEEIEKNNLKEYVKILGFKSNPYPYFKSADIVTMSSHHEGFPTVLAEGLYLGKPFISTKVGGIEELSDNGKCGIISSNVDDYSNKLLKLMNDKKTLSDMGNYGKTYIKKFTYEKQIQKLEKLFEEMNNE